MTYSEILDRLNVGPNKGPLLELVIEDILTDSKFTDVKRQNGGSQYGFDLIGYTNQECWKFECKNLAQGINISDIAPKMVWHTGRSAPDRFVIVSPNGFTNDVRNLLEKSVFAFPIEIWHSDYLASRIASSPRARLRLNIAEISALKTNLVPTIFSPTGVRFNVVYNEGDPYSIDYFFQDDKIIKSYTEVGFEVLTSITNPTDEVCVVHQINSKTLQYNKIDGRVLRQFKQKGLVEPLVLPLRLKPSPSGVCKLIPDNKIIELRPGSTEYIKFTLSEKGLVPGFYEFIFEATISNGNDSKVLSSNIFRINISDKKGNMVRLCVPGRYYDTPVCSILDLPLENWNKIRDVPDNSIFYLGHSIFDLPTEQPIDTWKIKEVIGIREKKNELTLRKQEPKIVLDLKKTIEEKILTTNDILGSYHRIKL